MLRFRKFPVAKKITDKRKGEYQDFPSKNFCLTVPKISVKESFTVALIWGIERVWIRGGGGGEYQKFPSKFFCLSAEKFRRGILYCCINFGYRKSLKKGVSRFHVENFFSQCRKLR